MSTPPAMIVTDMDGTLLNRNGQVSDRNAAALRRAADAGAIVAVATGRPAWWLDPVIEIGFDGTAICLNGAVVYDIAAKELISAAPLSPQVLTDFVTEFDAHRPGLAVAVERLRIDRPDAWAEESYVHPWNEGKFGVLPRSELLSEPAVKLLVRHGNDSGVLAAAALQVGFDAVAITYSTDSGLIEVCAAGVDKGAAVAELAGRHGIEAADVVVFGDMPNDEHMLRWAGHSFAMRGAHPIALDSATDQAPDNDADGVAQILEQWF